METKTILEETEDALMRFLKFNIRFSESSTTYALNSRWVNEIDDFHFTNQTSCIKQLIVKQLRHGLRHEEYLLSLVGQIWNRLECLQKYLHNTPDIIIEFLEIKNPEKVFKEPPLSNNKLYDEFIARQGQFKNQDSNRFNFLMLVSKYLNNYETNLDFQYGLLYYAIKKYYEAVYALHSYVFSLAKNAKFIDFKNLEVEDSKTFSVNSKTDIKVHFNQDKISLAHLFLFLLREKHIVFNENDERNNELKMKRIVEASFTYLSSSGERVAMKNFNREFSEARASTEVQKHKKFINKFIAGLEQYRDNLGD